MTRPGLSHDEELWRRSNSMVVQDNVTIYDEDNSPELDDDEQLIQPFLRIKDDVWEEELEFGCGEW